AWPEAITMTIKKSFPVEFKFPGSMVYGNVKFFFKVIIHPEVGISHKKIHRDPAGFDFCEFSQCAYKTFGNHMFVLNPKIKKITQEKDGSCVIFNGIQPFDKSQFPGPAGCSSRSTKMIIA